MRKLLTTTDDGTPAHHHILYVDEVTGEVIAMSESGDYPHEVTPQYASTDPQTGQPTGPITNWQISVAPDGHTHKVKEYELDYPVETEDESTILADMRALWSAASDEEGDSLKRAQESEDFYCGDQWDPMLKADLESKNRACLTINVTQRNLDELSGDQRQLRTDMRLLPTGDGDQVTADILNIVIKNICEQCFFEREESKVFDDQMIVGRGNFNLWVDFAQNIRGDIKIEDFGWRNILYGPHQKEDLSDCEYLFKHRMYSLGKLRSVWPEKAEQLKTDFSSYIMPTENSSIQQQGDGYADIAMDRMPLISNGTLMVDIAKKEYRLIELWRRIYFKSKIALDNQTEEDFPLLGWKAADIKTVEELGIFTVIDRTFQKMRVTRACGGVLLKDEHPIELPKDDFFVIPVYAKKRGKRFWGKVELLKDSQREINKRTSQCIDIGNRMASYGWFFDQMTFPNKEEKDRFRKNSATPGFTQEVTDVNRPPKQVDGIRFPEEIVSLQKMAFEVHTSLSNVVIAPDEGATAQEILQRKRMKLTGNEFLFDNLSFAKKKLGRLLVATIQKYKTPQSIWRLLVNANNKSPVQLGGQPFAQYTQEQIINLLQNQDLAAYDVIVSESQWSPSERIATMTLLQAMNAPADVVIPLTDIPEEQKQQIMKGMQQNAQSQQQMESEKSDTEIIKTLIAKDYIPPKVLEKYGITPRNAMTGEPAPLEQPPTVEQNNQPVGLGGV